MEDALKYASGLTVVAAEPDRTVAPNLALVLFAFGDGYVLTCELDDAVGAFVADTAGFTDGDQFDLDDAGADYETPADGLYVARLCLVDDGPGDYPWLRECALAVRDLRPATSEDWAAFRAGDYPWASPTAEEAGR